MLRALRLRVFSHCLLYVCLRCDFDHHVVLWSLRSSPSQGCVGELFRSSVPYFCAVAETGRKVVLGGGRSCRDQAGRKGSRGLQSFAQYLDVQLKMSRRCRNEKLLPGPSLITFLLRIPSAKTPLGAPYAFICRCRE